MTESRPLTAKEESEILSFIFATQHKTDALIAEMDELVALTKKIADENRRKLKESPTSERKTK